MTIVSVKDKEGSSSGIFTATIKAFISRAQKIQNTPNLIPSNKHIW